MTQKASQQTVIVTGASSGIGKAAAEAFAMMGWYVIGTGRNPERCDQAETDIRSAASADARVAFVRGDFSEMSDVKHIAGEIAGLTNNIHILINNAGGVRDQRYITEEGNEATFAANHLAPFLLTRELLPQLKTAASGSPTGTVRVLAVSSTAHEYVPSLNWDDLQNLETDPFPATPAYSQAKLANIMYTRELNRRVSDDGIVAHAMSPGIVLTNFASYGDDAMQAYLKDEPGATAEEAARTLVWMATSPECGIDGGRNFYELEEKPVSEVAQDATSAARLWSETEAILAGLGV
ncbi:MAG: SDR family NAD(P)-dependent oxidoreductase [Novosphingobium sp.]|nr:SDR family NAD(P)-dependent oxidoreductase [Novosphingobium sp.]